MFKSDAPNHEEILYCFTTDLFIFCTVYNVISVPVTRAFWPFARPFAWRRIPSVRVSISGPLPESRIQPQSLPWFVRVFATVSVRLFSAARPEAAIRPRVRVFEAKHTIHIFVLRKKCLKNKNAWKNYHRTDIIHRRYLYHTILLSSVIRTFKMLPTVNSTIESKLMTHAQKQGW